MRILTATIVSLVSLDPLSPSQSTWPADEELPKWTTWNDWRPQSGREKWSSTIAIFIPTEEVRVHYDIIFQTINPLLACVHMYMYFS